HMPPGDVDRAATDLGRFWDVFVAGGAATPEVAPELAEFATVVRRLHEEPREPAPASVHEGVRALIEADPNWWQNPSSVVLTVGPSLISPSGRVSVTAGGEEEPEKRPHPIRRLWPIVEFAGIAAAIL